MRCRTALSLLAFLALAVASSAQDLRQAVRDGDVSRVKSMLESGTDANLSYENGYTSIYFVNRLEVLELLLEHGAKFDLRNVFSESPIEFIAEKFSRCRDDKERGERRKIVERLQNARAEYTIDTAIYMNDIEFVRDKLKIDDSWVDDSGPSHKVPLKVAAENGRAEICKLLLEHDADPDAFQKCGGFSIMVYAAKHPAIVKLLIEHQADLTHRITLRGMRQGYWIIENDAPILHHVIGDGNSESVKLLLEAGVDPNATDLSEQTPLHIAVRYERWNRGYADSKEKEESVTSSFEQIISLLLDRDASLTLTNKDDQTPLQVAQELESPDSIIGLLTKRPNRVKQQK